MFKLKREFGLSDLIALGAVVISAIALWQSSQSNDANIIYGGGTVSYATVEESGKCSYALAFPFEFHNSGGEAVVLKQIAPRNANDPGVTVIAKDSILKEKDISYRMYLTQKPMVNFHPWLWEVKRQAQFRPSYNHVGEIIYPGSSYQFHVALIIDMNEKLRSQTELSAGVHFETIFSNGQVKSVGAIVELDPLGEGKCG